MSVLPVDSQFPSPSLGPAGGASRQAYELKFLLSEALAQQISQWAFARAGMQPDPHGDPQLNGAYLTTTLYLDTPQMDVYHRSPGYRSRKHRVRRYGAASWVSLECKTKRGDRLSKERSSLPELELTQLADPMSLETWPGHWFHQRLMNSNLYPACMVSYQRLAMVGSCAEGPLRLTLDRHIRGVVASTWSAATFEGGLPLLAGSVVLELKFLDAAPQPFKQLLAEFNLNPTSVSKYRACCEAWGVGQSGTKASRDQGIESRQSA